MHVVILGAAGGIGSALVKALADDERVSRITATYHRTQPDFMHDRISWSRVDLTDEQSIQDWASSLNEIDWLINAAGMLHSPEKGPEKTVRHIEPAFFQKNITVNILPTLLVAKHTCSKFRHGRPGIFATISAKVGSVEDNRLGGWYSYRISKAGLNMALKTLSIEWKRCVKNVAVIALHPGTTDTPLSDPFQKNVPPGQLFSPDQTAAYLLNVLRDLTPADTGQFIAFDGERLPW